MKNTLFNKLKWSVTASSILGLLGCAAISSQSANEYGISADRVAMNVAKALPATKVKPNILWILTDDQRADSIAAVNQALTGKKESELGYVESPNLDALAAEGVLFPLAYNQSPGCSPSRYSMATGQYPHHSGR